MGTIPLVILGAVWLGAPGVLIGQAVGGVVFGLLSLWLALRVIAKADAGEVTPKPQEPFARPARRMVDFHWKR